jgi:hypothetical protein
MADVGVLGNLGHTARFGAVITEQGGVAGIGFLLHIQFAKKDTNLFFLSTYVH